MAQKAAHLTLENIPANNSVSSQSSLNIEHDNKACSGSCNHCINSQLFHVMQQALGRGGGSYFSRGRDQSYNGRGFGRASKPTCQLCGVYGHVVANCFHRFDTNYYGRSMNIYFKGSARP